MNSTKEISEKIIQNKKKNLKLSLKTTLNDREAGNRSKRKSLLEGNFENRWGISQFVKNIKPTKKLFYTICIGIYTRVSEVYT